MFNKLYIIHHFSTKNICLIKPRREGNEASAFGGY